MSRWVGICAIEDIPRLGARVVDRAGGERIALFRTASDRVFALADRCPHKGGPLSQGLVTGDRVICPLHGWTIELAAGRAVAPDEGCAQSFTVDIRDGRVCLRADDLAIAGQPVVPIACRTDAMP